VYPEDSMEQVTVILPTYNRASSVEKAIESVRKQTYPAWKLIVVDDGSTDGTWELVQKIKEKRIRYVRNEKNGGPSYSRNVGAKLADTKYIAFQDSDTVWHPRKLERQVMELEENKDYIMVYHPYHLSGAAEGIYPKQSIPIEEKRGNIYKSLLYCSMIGTPCMLLKRDIFLQAGGFAEELRCLEDYELSLRLAKMGSIGFLEEVLLEAEDSENSVGKNVRNEIHALFYIMTHYYDDLEENPFAKKLLFNRISKLAVENQCMELFYEKAEKYLFDTGQNLEDLMKLYQAQ